jgi:hypothetical protein
MSTNPYQSGGSNSNPYAAGTVMVSPGSMYGGGTGDGFGVEPVQPRTSKMAVTSMILAILSLVGCCVIVVSPTLGALAMLLAVFAMFRVSTSHGRLRGKGYAITGLVTGLIALVLGIAILLGIQFSAGQAMSYAKAVEASEQGNLDEFNGYLSTPMDKAALDAFTNEWTQNSTITYDSVKPGIMALIRGFTRGNTAQLIPSLQGQYPGAQVVPFEVQFSNGPGVVVVVADPSTQQPPNLMLGEVLEMMLLVPDGAGGFRTVALSDYANAVPGAAPAGTVPQGDAAPKGDAPAGDAAPKGDAPASP